jgi:hypothetical protein
MIGCDAELRSRKAGRLRQLRYLILQPPKPKKRSVAKLSIATNHLISVTHIQNCHQVSLLTRTWGYERDFLQSFELQEFKLYVY